MSRIKDCVERVVQGESVETLVEALYETKKGLCIHCGENPEKDKRGVCTKCLERISKNQGNKKDTSLIRKIR